MTSKTTTETATSYVTETVVYKYNLQNRLTTVTTTLYVGGVAQSPTVTEYTYNPDGIRVGKLVDSTTQTDYLIDPYNHTGYAQVLEEATGTDVTYYILGDDMLAQTLNTNSPQYLLYDGHGSTRQLVASDGSTIVDSYSYDAYGFMLGGNPTSAAPAATNLLYAGEQFDTDAQQYYLRARYYNPSNGLFNRTDPYAGNTHDPQSIHKYAYVHNNPVNNIDPLGLWNTVQVLVVTGIIANLFAIYLDTARLIKATRDGNDIEAFFAKLWLGIDILTLCIPFSGGASLAFAGGRTLTLSVVHIARLRIGLALYRAAATTGDYIDGTVDSHGSQPSPRPDGTESHHGVLDKWMKDNFQNYNSNKAPSLLMPKSAHDQTRAVYNTWRTMMRDRMGGAFDWSKVSLSEMRQLSKQMMDAAKVSPEMQKQFWEAFEEYHKTLIPK